MKAAPKTEDPPHPPLARDPSGNLLPVPEGTAAWRLCRQTRGRPRTVNGPDGEPYRFPLELDTEALEDMCGAGSYRVYALDEVGNVLDYVTTVHVGVDGATAEPASAAQVRNAATVSTTSATSTDLRFALETIAQMSRSSADSLRAVAEAQADWVKAIALAKGLPRNVPLAALALPPASRSDDDDDERRGKASDDDRDDDGDDDDGAAPRSGMDALLTQFAPMVPELMAIWRSSVLNRAEAHAQRNAKTTTASGRDPMIHLARVLAGLTRRERTVVEELLDGSGGSEIARELNKRSVEDAIAFIRDNVEAAEETVRAERGGGEDRRLVAAEPSDTAPGEAPAIDPETMTKLLAALKQLGPRERARLIKLRPRIVGDAALVAELQTVLRPMSVDEVAAWVRANLDQLEARFSS